VKVSQSKEGERSLLMNKKGGVVFSIIFWVIVGIAIGVWFALTLL